MSPHLRGNCWICHPAVSGIEIQSQAQETPVLPKHLFERLLCSRHYMLTAVKTGSSEQVAPWFDRVTLFKVVTVLGGDSAKLDLVGLNLQHSQNVLMLHLKASASLGTSC